MKQKLRRNDYAKQWQLINPDYRKRYYENNKEKLRASNTANSIRYQMKKIKATPVYANHGVIKQYYALAQLYNEIYPEYAPWEVDHIVPIRGKNVCGFHIETNLQILPRTENRKKGNKHDNVMLGM